jgi:hypothetical protein
MFCAPELVFGGAEYVGSCFLVWRARLIFCGIEGVGCRFLILRARNHFHVFRSWTCFWPCGGRWVPFHVLRSLTCFWRYRGHRVLFSRFARRDSLSAEPRATTTVFMFFILTLIFGGTKGCRVPFSSFALPGTFSAVRMVSGLDFMFCAPRLIFGGTECVQTRFMFCAPEHILSRVECVGSCLYVLCARTRFRLLEDDRFCFHVLCAKTHFWRHRWRRAPFSCFTIPDSFSAVPMASAPVFMFCAPGLVFGSIEGVGCRFHVLRARTRFQRYRGRRVTFSCFARPVSFSAVTRATGLVFIFYAPRLVFSGNEGFRSYFHVLRVRTRFRPYRGRRVPFSCFARPNSFAAVKRATGLIFLFCTPGIVFVATEGVGSRFHALRARTRFRRYRGRQVPF